MTHGPAGTGPTAPTVEAVSVTGAVERALSGGQVGAADAVTVEHRPAHAVTAARWFGAQDPADARRLPAAGEDGLELAPALVRYLEASLVRA